jgi:hypothetical protein
MKRAQVVGKNNKWHGDEIEQQRLNYNHVEALAGMGIVAAIAIGGLVCMAVGVPAGKDIVLAVLGFSAGYGIKSKAGSGAARRRPIIERSNVSDDGEP